MLQSQKAQQRGENLCNAPIYFMVAFLNISLVICASVNQINKTFENYYQKSEFKYHRHQISHISLYLFRKIDNRTNKMHTHYM